MPVASRVTVGSWVYSFPREAVKKYHKLGVLKHPKHILSQFWRLEVQNQGVSRARLPWMA